MGSQTRIGHSWSGRLAAAAGRRTCARAPTTRGPVWSGTWTRDVPKPLQNTRKTKPRAESKSSPRHAKILLPIPSSSSSARLGSSPSPAKYTSRSRVPFLSRRDKHKHVVAANRSDACPSRDGHGGRGQAPPPAPAPAAPGCPAGAAPRERDTVLVAGAGVRVAGRGVPAAAGGRGHHGGGRGGGGQLRRRHQLPAGPVAGARPLAPPRRALPRRRLHALPRLRQWVR